MKPSEAIKYIIESRDSVDDSSPLSIADSVCKLARGNSYLAPFIADAHYNASHSQISAYKAARDLDNKIGDSEMLGKWESLEKRKVYEKMDYIYKSTKDLIYALGKKLTAMEDQIKREGQNET